MSRKTDQADDALKSFEWQPSKDSDELFEALKLTFPKGRTHRARMREALIELLVQECEAERDTRQGPPPPELDLSTESTTTEDKVQQNGLTEAASSVSRTSQTSAHRPDTVAKVPHRKRLPKDWDDMTVVWTSEDGILRKSGPKRTMTDQERADYQLRRLQGACAVCRKKKRKVKVSPTPCVREF